MTRIVVTGAAGFIGSNLIKALNARGVQDIIAVDELKQGDKFRNLVDLHISDYLDASDFYSLFALGHFGQVDAVFHEGACSDTMEQDGQYMMQNNYRCTLELMQHCMKQGTRLLYASSAATYGNSSTFIEHPRYEHPLNVYGYSKLLTDQVLRQRFGNALQHAPHQIVGFRYFNVYGPREQHKARMASVAFHQFHQYQQAGHVKLFEGYGGYAAGQQQRDFVHVDDVCAVNLWFYDHPEKRGIFNLGTGRAQPFNDVALAVINRMAAHEGKAPMTLSQAVEAGKIVYIPFPDALRGKYQSFTQADLSQLKQVGCGHSFMDVATGVDRYVTDLLRSSQ